MVFGYQPGPKRMRDPNNKGDSDQDYMNRMLRGHVAGNNNQLSPLPQSPARTEEDEKREALVQVFEDAIKEGLSVQASGNLLERLTMVLNTEAGKTLQAKMVAAMSLSLEAEYKEQMDQQLTLISDLRSDLEVKNKERSRYRKERDEARREK